MQARVSARHPKKWVGGSSVILVRKATLEDLNKITEIYNEAVLHTAATFDTQIKTVQEQEKWFWEHDQKHPILVAEKEGCVVGWASLSPWSDRCAYSDTAENSLYVEKTSQGDGIGKLLMKALLELAEQANLHTIIARITDGNQTSIKLHEKFGFEHIGIMREVGRKFGKLLDVYLMQKILG